MEKSDPKMVNREEKMAAMLSQTWQNIEFIRGPTYKTFNCENVALPHLQEHGITIWEKRGGRFLDVV
jgi:hypothetical protein